MSICENVQLLSALPEQHSSTYFLLIFRISIIDILSWTALTSIFRSDKSSPFRSQNIAASDQRLFVATILAAKKSSQRMGQNDLMFPAIIS